jgi:hypothetical protein
VSDLPPPNQPYRTVALFHAALAIVILIVAALSGGDLAKAVAVAAAYFVLATAWSWFRFRQRQNATKRPDPMRNGGRP